MYLFHCDRCGKTMNPGDEYVTIQYTFQTVGKDSVDSHLHQICCPCYDEEFKDFGNGWASNFIDEKDAIVSLNRLDDLYFKKEDDHAESD